MRFVHFSREVVLFCRAKPAKLSCSWSDFRKTFKTFDVSRRLHPSLHLLADLFISSAVWCGAGADVREPRGRGQLLGQLVTLLNHIWHLICCVITNKICQLPCFASIWHEPRLHLTALIFLELTVSGPAQCHAALRIQMQHGLAAWQMVGVAYVRGVWTVDCNICMNDFSFTSAW